MKNDNNGVVIPGERLYGSCDVNEVKMEILVVNVLFRKIDALSRGKGCAVPGTPLDP